MNKPFFIRQVSFDLDRLTLAMTDGTEPIGDIVFDRPRAFRFFSDSDAYEYLAAYDGETLLEGRAGSGIYRSRSSPYLDEYLRATPEHRRDDPTFSVLVQTPQECVEVVTFEDPLVTFDWRAEVGER